MRKEENKAARKGDEDRRTVRFDDETWASIKTAAHAEARALSERPSVSTYLARLHREHMARNHELSRALGKDNNED